MSGFLNSPFFCCNGKLGCWQQGWKKCMTDNGQKRLLVILVVIKCNMLVLDNARFTPQRFQIKYRVLEYCNQTLYLIGGIIRVLGPCRVVGPHKVLDPCWVLGSHKCWVFLRFCVLIGSQVPFFRYAFLSSRFST